MIHVLSQRMILWSGLWGSNSGHRAFKMSLLSHLTNKSLGNTDRILTAKCKGNCHFINDYCRLRAKTDLNPYPR